jgi:hypothetical protein
LTNSLLTSRCLRDQHHVRLMVDDRGYSLAKKRMLIDTEDSNTSPMRAFRTIRPLQHRAVVPR